MYECGAGYGFVQVPTLKWLCDVFTSEFSTIKRAY